eukprot:GILJ01006801.1.p1 GENE.GILJ01006801.1~~GILJ01006801.1.p1  ORF type:complete len:1039 (-),score=197.04 GILJ01006801.1:301-3417(-)
MSTDSGPLVYSFGDEDRQQRSSELNLPPHSRATLDRIQNLIRSGQQASHPASAGRDRAFTDFLRHREELTADRPISNSQPYPTHSSHRGEVPRQDEIVRLPAGWRESDRQLLNTSVQAQEARQSSPPRDKASSSRTSPQRHNVFDRLLLDNELRKHKQAVIAEEEERLNGSLSPRINNKSKEIQRDGNVENLLFLKDREYKYHKEQLRAQHLESEISQLRSSPEINPSSRGLQRQGSVEDRLHQYGTYVKMKQYEKREQEIAREDSMPREPIINPVSQQINRGVDRLLDWNDTKQLKRIQQKLRLEEEKTQDLLFHPRISEVSQKIVDKMGRGAEPIEDKLLRQAEISRLNKEVRRKQIEASYDEEAVPTISAHSSNLIRKGPIGERLYTQGLQVLQKKRELEQQATSDMYFVPASAFSKSTSKGHSSGEGSVTETTAGLSRSPTRDHLIIQRDEPVEDALRRRGFEYEQKREQMIREQERQLEEERNRRKALKQSQILAEQLEKRTRVSAADRLTAPIVRRLGSSTTEILMEEKSNMTFKPQINPKSAQLDTETSAVEELTLSHPSLVNKIDDSQIDSRRRHSTASTLAGRSKSPFDRADKLYRKYEQYKQHKEELKVKKEKEELTGCTFAPQLETKRREKQKEREKEAKEETHEREQLNNNIIGVMPKQKPVKKEGFDQVIARNEEWLRKREEKIEAHRKEKANKSLEGYSFKPTFFTKTHKHVKPRAVTPATTVSRGRPVSAGMQRSKSAGPRERPKSAVNHSSHGYAMDEGVPQVELISQFTGEEDRYTYGSVSERFNQTPPRSRTPPSMRDSRASSVHVDPEADHGVIKWKYPPSNRSAAVNGQTYGGGYGQHSRERHDLILESSHGRGYENELIQNQSQVSSQHPPATFQRFKDEFLAEREAKFEHERSAAAELKQRRQYDQYIDSKENYEANLFGQSVEEKAKKWIETLGLRSFDSLQDSRKPAGRSAAEVLQNASRLVEERRNREMQARSMNRQAEPVQSRTNTSTRAHVPSRASVQAEERPFVWDANGY